MYIIFVPNRKHKYRPRPVTEIALLLLFLTVAVNGKPIGKEAKEIIVAAF
jgi:hypothetical protein